MQDSIDETNSAGTSAARFVPEAERLALLEAHSCAAGRQRAAVAAARTDGLTQRAAEIREEALARAEELWQAAEAAFTAAGAQVHRARDAQAARELLLELTSPSDRIAKSKSSVVAEVDLRACQRRFVETDIGDWIIAELGTSSWHPVTPAIGVGADNVAGLLREKHGLDVPPTPQALADAIAGRIRREVMESDVGITGGNFVTRHGELFLLENEGNIALVTTLPQRHIAFVGLDKIVREGADALHLARCLAIFGTGQPVAGRLHVISGPSRTADIGQDVVIGANGPREVHIVVVDNGRAAMLQDRKTRQALRCIGCGYCLLNCPVYQEIGRDFGGTYLGGIGLVKSHFLGTPRPAGRLEACLGCELCEEQCPVGSKIYDNVKKARAAAPTEVSRAIRSAIMTHGNAARGSDVWQVGP